ncbi:Bug family tripartite tricarboxylate transporter substrate binding protein [Bordetella sp. H567]|uniref:Bug family tripartite tricarboxylate transporter substrate binding protein n=1 Tax=Bordetella sp. H567 TaxID=1697043 RepID=UPI00083606A7|nr:tripartite tricarboxylate transporter substrate binding protein [Bordetella sp. H567]
MIRNKRRAVLMAAALAACCTFSAAQADDWKPVKPIRIVVPIVGSTNDVLARLVAPELGAALGQPVVVENKGGGGGLIGTMDVVKSAPDGYTLLVGYNGPITINPTLLPQTPYDPVKDLAPITLAVKASQYLVVNPKVPVKTLAQFVDYAKSHRMSYASVSVGSSSHLTMEMLKQAAHIDLTHVPYRGAGPAVVDLIGGQVDAAFLVPGNIQDYAKDGRARLIASSGLKRFPSTPDVPTVAESGYPGFDATSWIGFLAPAGTPQPIMDRLNTEMVRILKSPKVRKQLEDMEFEVVASTPREFSDWIKVDAERWAKVIKTADIKGN